MPVAVHTSIQPGPTADARAKHCDNTGSNAPNTKDHNASQAMSRWRGVVVACCANIGDRV
jgi:hypothetical protein